MKYYLLSLLIITAISTTAQTNDVRKVKVTGDRVSLRAKPTIDSELLDRAMRGEELILLGETNAWVAVQAPDTLDFWVSGEYIQNGIVVPEKLNVRSGPSKNYSVVFIASQGDAFSLRGEFNNWIKISPPIGSVAWISEQYVEPLIPLKPEPTPAPEPEPEPEPPPVVKIPTPEPEKPKIPELTEAERKPILLIMDKNKPQGVYDEIPGILRRSHPGLYKLVMVMGDIEEPICLVRGNEAQMNTYLNRSLLIKGKRYWAKGVLLPILKVEKIHLDPILSE